jgi:ABC-type dipeptide/oligopeptide/nickel transport system permease subunit
MFSARTTLIITAAVVLSGSLLLGNGLGLLAGYRGGWIDDAIMRVGEVFSSLPALVMLILINAALSSRVLDGVRWVEDNTFITGLVASGFASYITVFAALSLFFWVGTARIIRAQVLQLREREFVMAAESLGASQRRIIVRHVLPSVTFLIVLQISATLGSIAGSEILLSWFGVGIQPPAPSFGAMIFEGSGARTFQAHPNLLLVPGIIVSLLLLSFSLLGDALNDAIASR